MLCNVVLVSAVQQGESTTYILHMYIYPPPTLVPPHPLIHPSKSSQSTKLNPQSVIQSEVSQKQNNYCILKHILGLAYPSYMLYISLLIPSSRSILPLPLPLGNHKFVFWVWSLFLLCRHAHGLLRVFWYYFPHTHCFWLVGC